VSQTKWASDTSSSLLWQGRIKPRDASGNARTAKAAATAESIPPETPRTKPWDLASRTLSLNHSIIWIISASNFYPPFDSKQKYGSQPDRMKLKALADPHYNQISQTIAIELLYRKLLPKPNQTATQSFGRTAFCH
jgi:hypothetical protein